MRISDEGPLISWEDVRAVLSGTGNIIPKVPKTFIN
jgi:hypothetical protein